MHSIVLSLFKTQVDVCNNETRYAYALSNLEVERIAVRSLFDLEDSAPMDGVARVARVSARPARTVVASGAGEPVAQVQHVVALTNAQE